MVLMPSAIIAFAISVTVLAGLGTERRRALPLVCLVVAVASIGAANYMLYYNLAISEGNLRLSRYVGLPATEVPLGSIQHVSVSAKPAGRMLGKVAFVTANQARIEIAPRLWRKRELTAVIRELQGLGVDVDDSVWTVVDRG